MSVKHVANELNSPGSPGPGARCWWLASWTHDSPMVRTPPHYSVAPFPLGFLPMSAGHTKLISSDLQVACIWSPHPAHLRVGTSCRRQNFLPSHVGGVWAHLQEGKQWSVCAEAGRVQGCVWQETTVGVGMGICEWTSVCAWGQGVWKGWKPGGKPNILLSEYWVLWVEGRPCGRAKERNHRTSGW